jgi:hypothetical protein
MVERERERERERGREGRREGWNNDRIITAQHYVMILIFF